MIFPRHDAEIARDDFLTDSSMKGQADPPPGDINWANAGLLVAVKLVIKHDCKELTSATMP
jgi:hypothetical protein